MLPLDSACDACRATSSLDVHLKFNLGLKEITEILDRVGL
jgi:hypothetical protein